MARRWLWDVIGSRPEAANTSAISKNVYQGLRCLNFTSRSGLPRLLGFNFRMQGRREKKRKWGKIAWQCLDAKLFVKFCMLRLVNAAFRAGLFPRLPLSLHTCLSSSKFFVMCVLPYTNLNFRLYHVCVATDKGLFLFLMSHSHSWGIRSISFRFPSGCRFPFVEHCVFLLCFACFCFYTLQYSIELP